MTDAGADTAAASAADLVVCGAGPAGLAAAIAAAQLGRRVVLLDQATRPGVKILISGGNRCNLTHDCDAAAIAAAFGRAGSRFLGHALRERGPRELKRWIESLGVATKVEPGGKVFPVSNRAVDVRDALEQEVARVGVRFVGGASIASIERCDAGFTVATARGLFGAPRLVLTLGGRSYPKVGTKGDGYRFAASLGHTIVATTPALVPLVATSNWVRELSGVTLPDVVLSLPAADARREPPQRGALLFTHFGLSGPAPMNVGGAVARELGAGASSVPLQIDFLPTHERAALDARFAQATVAGDARLVRTVVGELLPRRVAEALTLQAGIAATTAMRQLGAAARARLLDALFAMKLALVGTRGFDFAEVTRGGVALAEVDPATLQSRVVPGLYLAGELLDVDGPIGGYNFTAAFATGALAGRSAAQQ